MKCQEPCVTIQIDSSGKAIQGSIKQNAEQAHIPLEEYKSWKNWDSP